MILDHICTHHSVPRTVALLGAPLAIRGDCVLHGEIHGRGQDVEDVYVDARPFSDLNLGWADDSIWAIFKYSAARLYGS